MTFSLLKELKNYQDLSLSVVLLNEGTLANKLREQGLKVHVIDEKHHRFWDIARKARRILGASPPDIIHSHRYKENMLAALTSLSQGGAELLATQHGLPECLQEASLATRLITSANFHLLSHRFAKTVAVSHDIRKVLIQRQSFSADKVEVIHNGIDIPAPRMPASGSGPMVIGSSGRLAPVKDYPLMIEIAGALTSINRNGFRFELAGEGPERPVLEALIERHGLQERFFLKGHLDDMEGFHHGIDLYIVTSLHEGIPMSVLEAMAQGLPVVAPAVGGLLEIIDDGREGFLIEGRNPADYAQKCLLLRDNHELRRRMSQAAREKAERAFSARIMAERYYRLYRRIASCPI
ncbi:glycosyltransferase family 4 protein [Geobacter sp. SVR]|uniref:glycosyltransferase family 4 protein n=1 Tax=Geobacter sp. SVR TaxID=2495594 RepID=UPI00143F04EC|nr:glycosyltransferase family 4 protein [Geobacter sp. SVR]BCS54950.1 hypothetical protein GSVR_32580 [Geobacter sp. SVR]GCF86149.1 hypothetical protein GSbR_27490 [Geobacter sp. SVR]